MNNRVEMPFIVSIPFNELLVKDGRTTYQLISIITFSGMAYKYNNEDPGQEYDYDIDDVRIGNEKIPMQLFDALGIELKENDDVHNPIMSLIQKTFIESLPKTSFQC